MLTMPPCAWAKRTTVSLRPISLYCPPLDSHKEGGRVQQGTFVAAKGMLLRGPVPAGLRANGDRASNPYNQFSSKAKQESKKTTSQLNIRPRPVSPAKGESDGCWTIL